MKTTNPATVPGFVLCIGEFLYLAFGQESINKRFYQVFIFLVQFSTSLNWFN